MKLLRVLPVVLMLVPYAMANVVSQREKATQTDTYKTKPESYKSEMIEAINTGNLQRVQELSKKIDITNNEMFDAINANNPQRAQELAKKIGSDQMNPKDDYMFWFLQGAVQQKADIKTIKTLLEMIEAINAGNLQRVQELSKKFDVNHHLTFSPLEMVIQQKNADIKTVQALIDAGADVNVQGAGNFTLLQSAARRGNLKIVKALIRAGAKVNQQGSLGATPLLDAAQMGHIEIVNELLHAGADANIENINGNIPLNNAAFNGNLEAVKVLIAAKSNVNHLDNMGRSALYGIANSFVDLKNQKAITKALIQAGARLDQQNKDGETPLHAAALRGNSGLVKVLINAKANLNIKNKDGFTPLDAAKNLVKSLATDPKFSGIPDKDKTINNIEAVIGLLENYKAPTK